MMPTKKNIALPAFFLGILCCFAADLQAQHSSPFPGFTLPREDPSEVTLLFAGDAMQHQAQIDHALRGGTFDYSSYFQHIQYEVSAADLAIVNLEVTLGGKPFRGYPMFSAPDELAVALRDAGFDVFLTANNHILDRSSRGVVRTLSVLDSLGVAHTGAFRDSAERRQSYPLLVEVKGLRIALLNYTYDTNGIRPKPSIEVNYIDTVRIKEDIAAARRQQPDLLIANMHWGVEYKLRQHKSQEQLAAWLVREGVDIVMGSHPHVIQPALTLRDEAGAIRQVIVYSLGNLVSAMRAENTDGGQLIRIVARKEAGKTTIVSCGSILHYTYKHNRGDKIDFEVVPVSLAEQTKGPLSRPTDIELDAFSYRKMSLFARNARSIMEKYNDGVKEYRIRTREEKTVLPLKPPTRW